MHTSAAITHQLGGRHRYFPAHNPLANDSAAHIKGCRREPRFCKFAGFGEFKTRAAGVRIRAEVRGPEGPLFHKP
jgi:hypothetical protein